MKKIFLIIPLSAVLYGCPYESKVPLVKAPVEPVDSSLLGYWYGIVKDGSDFFGIEALDITKQSDSMYNITRYGKAAKGDMILPDTSYFTGFISYLGDKRFMNIESSIVIVNTRGKKPPEIITEKVFYISTIELRHDTLTVQTITENFIPPNYKGFKTPEELTQAVLTLTGQKKNIYDELYSLSYRKIPKPQPLKGF
jgi:hypothetical protein